MDDGKEFIDKNLLIIVLLILLVVYSTILVMAHGIGVPWRNTMRYVEQIERSALSVKIKGNESEYKTLMQDYVFINKNVSFWNPDKLFLNDGNYYLCSSNSNFDKLPVDFLKELVQHQLLSDFVRNIESGRMVLCRKKNFLGLRQSYIVAERIQLPSGSWEFYKKVQSTKKRTLE